MQTLIQDLRYAFRMLARNPGFAAVTAITLALGIGANSAIFSVVHAVLLNPLPYHEPDRLVLVNHNYLRTNLRASVSAFGYRHYRDHARSFESLAATSWWAFNLTDQGEAERLVALRVTPNFFSTLGVEPAAGRTFLEEEDEEGRNRVVVLSHGFWQRRFAGDPSILSQTITLDGQSYTVVGLMPPGFQYGNEMGLRADIWTPIVFTPEQLSPNRLTWEFLQVVGRLGPGISHMQAQAELDQIADELRAEFMPDYDSSYWGLTMDPLQERLVGDLRISLWMLLGAVGFVLLIACANVANLLLVRADARHKEIAIRSALGAGRKRIARQLLTESMLLALLGGGMGLILAWWSIEFFKGLERIPRSAEVGLNGTVLVFTLGLSALTGLLSGIAPTFRTSVHRLNDALKEGGRTGSSNARQNIRRSLVVLETALALVLLVGAGLLIRSFQRVQEVHPGFEPAGVLSMHLALPQFKYPEAHQIDQFYRGMLDAVRKVPGVESAGAITTLPLSGFDSMGSFQIEGRVIPAGEPSPHGARWRATPGYFETMKIRLLRGRFFDDRDTADAGAVAVIDEELARKYWPGEEALGQRIAFGGGPSGPLWREIVGIVEHVKWEGLEGESRAQYYLPHSQSPEPMLFLVVRSAGDPAGLTDPVRTAIREVDPDLPVALVRTLELVVAEATARRRYSTLLLGVFAGVALVLAAVGIYGVTAYSASRRTQEVGVRMALGARTKDVLSMVIGQGIILTAIGIAIGWLGALVLTRFISGLLFGVQPTDFLTFLAVSLFLLTVSLAAAAIPARRAAKVDPTVALRYE